MTAKFKLSIISSYSPHEHRSSGPRPVKLCSDPGLTKPGEVGEIKVALFLFASRSFLANNLRFKVKVMTKQL